MTIRDLPTPSLLLDRSRMTANLKRMGERIDRLGGVLRPHIKTHKSIDVWRHVEQYGTVRGLTVSTLREAAYFFDNGVRDIFYAVSIAPNKFEEAASLIRKGCDLKVTLDSIETAKALGLYGAGHALAFPVVIELDVDAHRSGVDPQGELLIEIASVLDAAPGATLAGVMTHAGESYNCASPEALRALAASERELTVRAAERLRGAGYACPVVSIGSTPTICSVEDLSGVTEVRPGVYTFFDLVMRGVGVCRTDDIAVSVLTTVIGHQRERGWIITDGGWMAMSRDRGASSQDVDYGYGQVCDLDGEPIEDLAVTRANQEHGVIARCGGGAPPWDKLPIGALVRVLPNHACATSAQYDAYQVIEGGRVVDAWPRIRGW